MPSHPITEAILAEAWSQTNQPYTTARRIQGYFRNALRGARRQLFGGSTNTSDQARAFGTNVISAVPKMLTFTADMVPVVGFLVGELIDKIGNLAADKITDRLGDARQKDLLARQKAGTMSVAELTEYINREGDSTVGNDAIGKMRDAMRKCDEAWADARQAIIAANDCDSVYKAAKKYSYLKYRVVRMNYYIERIREYLDSVQEVSDRYSSQIIGFELDLVEGMDEFFKKATPEYHTKHCTNASNCYYKQHGIA
ncbi:MAG: hypothetical protein KDA79_20955 [Planctomycetaceae bacterium]|nr:hypothetical protein [Planctomycetaceae bacterium]